MGFNEKNKLFAEAPRLFDRARALGLISLKPGQASASSKRVAPARVGLLEQGKNMPKLYPIEVAVASVVEWSGVPEWKLMSTDRTGPVCLARNCGYKLIRDGGYSWQECGERFDRTHANTAMGGADMVEVKLATDLAFRGRWAGLVAVVKAKADLPQRHGGTESDTVAT